MSNGLTYYTDQELPGIPFEWLDYDGSIIDFSSGWSFTVKLIRGNTVVASQTTSITGAATSPNITLAGWTSATLTLMAADLTSLGRTSNDYKLLLYARRSADSADDVLRPAAPPVVTFKTAAT
jgi:hypothetical protein